MAGGGAPEASTDVPAHDELDVPTTPIVAVTELGDAHADVAAIPEAHGVPSPVASAPPVADELDEHDDHVDEDHYVAELSMLAEMGFIEPMEARKALCVTRGDVSAAVELLLSPFGQMNMHGARPSMAQGPREHCAAPSHCVAQPSPAACY